MVKALGVMGLWGLLVAAPHATGAPPPGEDPGDPFALQNPAAAKPRAAVPGAFATVHFRNEVGKAYRLVEAHFDLDGKELPAPINVKPGEDVVVFAGRVTPGAHVAKTRLVYQGNRRSVISYTSRHRLTVESEQVLTVPPERAVHFTIAGKENKGFNVPFHRQVGIEVRDRPAPVTN